MTETTNKEEAGDKFRNNMEALRQSYLRRLNTHVSEMRRLQEILGQGIQPANDLQQLYRITHNLAGSGTTFGYPEISQSARELHNALRHMIDDQSEDHLPTELAQQQVLEKVAAFIEIYRDAAARRPASISSSVVAATSGDSESRRIVIWARRSNDTQEMSSQLHHFGFDVVQVSTTEQLAAELAMPPHALLLYTSLSKPDMTSLHKVLPEQPTFPIMVLSTHDDFDARLGALRLGVRGFFQEGVNAIQVITRIEEMVDRARPQSSPSVLVVDDDEMLGEFYSHTLRHAGMKTIALSNPREAIRLLANQKIDVALINANMPYCSGIELAAIIRQSEDYARLPVIYTSSRDSMAMGSSSLGIDDFLSKPFTPEQLVAAIHRSILRGIELRASATHDSLTNVLNRDYFLRLLAAELRQDEAERNTMFGIVRLDDFRKINDTYGLAAGEETVRTLARMLQQRLRRNDMIGRLSRHEFGIMMPSCNKEAAARILDSIRSIFSATPCRIGAHTLQARISIAYLPLSSGTPDEILTNTEALLLEYDNKGAA